MSGVTGKIFPGPRPRPVADHLDVGLGVSLGPIQRVPSTRDRYGTQLGSPFVGKRPYGGSQGTPINKGTGARLRDTQNFQRGKYNMGKEGYGVEALRVTRGDGISGFSSRSDQARARELAKYGLTMKWYDDKSQEQGEGICADCSKQETARLGNGKRRPLGLGFNSDGTPDRLVCTTCASKQRKKRMEEKNAPKDYASFQEFWQANRENEKDSELLKGLRDRHAYVSELYEAVVDYVRGTDNCPDGLQDTLDEVTAELCENGTTDLDQLSVPFYRVEQRHLFDEIQEAAETPDAPKHARNAAVFAKYGWVAALPVSAGDHVIREFLRKNQRWPYPDWSPKPNPIKTIKCSTYQCKGEFTYDEREKIPGWYFSTAINRVVPPPQWWCEKCRAEQRARHDKRIGRTLAEVAPDRPYFVNGRLTTADTSNAAWFQKLGEL